MTMPAISRTWSITANNRIVYSSLVGVMGSYLFAVKQFLITQGSFTVKGSSNGSTAGMDGVDRWLSSANAQTRGANSVAAQSWIVLTDGNGVDILLTYQGASDDISRFSVSFSGAFTGSTTAQPTAADEQVLNSATSTINSSTVFDRVWFGWIDSTKKNFRVAIAMQGSWTGRMWGVELASSTVTGTNTSWSPAVWGFSWPVTPSVFGNNTVIGQAKPLALNVLRQVSAQLGIEQLGGSGTHTTIAAAKAELHGANGYIVIPLSLGSSTANARGKLGNLVDWWGCRASGGNDGDLYDSKRFIGMAGLHGNVGGMLWPWDGATIPKVY